MLPLNCRVPLSRNFFFVCRGVTRANLSVTGRVIRCAVEIKMTSSRAAISRTIRRKEYVLFSVRERERERERAWSSIYFYAEKWGKKRKTIPLAFFFLFPSRRKKVSQRLLNEATALRGNAQCAPLSFVQIAPFPSLSFSLSLSLFSSSSLSSFYASSHRRLGNF